MVMVMELAEKDFLWIGLGVGALWLIFRNTKPLSENIITPLSQTVKETASVVNPLLSAAGKGASVVTDPQSYKPYVSYLLEAPFTAPQAWTLFKQQPGISTFINAAATSAGLWT
jgi:hypothetical protein